jgi:predicted SAM-dependent methyltransferase
MLAQRIKDVYFGLSRYLCLPATALARLRYARKRPDGGFHVHLGCGHKYLPGLINADGNVFRKIDLWIDLRNRLPFPDASCALVYSSHTLEHLFPDEAIALLREIRRVLAPDGVARIAVPSFEHAMAVASGGRAEDWPRPFDDPVGQAVNYLFCEGQHKYAYSYSILENFARQAGFADVEHTSAIHGVKPLDYGGVSVGDEPEGSLVVELRTRSRD